ncbi:hypothetical protein CDL15_Pgr011791 [Punica granatum]|uniref:Uncharacterized protein n=1 Tax=Punica granatum TaxID=22663 RepID=A0A218XEK1_PUNGR|nr:hypothetical protein CDL15_Pgr011791 [Punica granatum]
MEDLQIRKLSHFFRHKAGQVKTVELNVGDTRGTIRAGTCYIVEDVDGFDEVVETSPASVARNQIDL